MIPIRLPFIPSGFAAPRLGGLLGRRLAWALVTSATWSGNKSAATHYSIGGRNEPFPQFVDPCQPSDGRAGFAAGPEVTYLPADAGAQLAWPMAAGEMYENR